MKSVILILSHRGQSFLAEWADALVETKASGFILSSKLLVDKDLWLSNVNSAFVGTRITDDEDLCYTDLLEQIESLKKQNIKVSAVVSVWEAYREIMARSNAYLGIPDLDESRIHSLRDKLTIRELLHTAGLSPVQAAILDEAEFDKAKLSSGQKFIKPRFGVASFGAFRLTKDTSWDDVRRLRHQMYEDVSYRSFFLADNQFIVEDFISGQEFSLEVAAGGGTWVILACHEKVEMQSEGSTTLETACVSPPISLSEKDAESMQNWLGEVMTILGITEGVYHIEARFDGTAWDLIEVNPRVGGAFILHSTIQVSGISLMTVWLQLLLQADAHERMKIISDLKERAFGRLRQNHLPYRTFFRVYFAKPNVVIKNIKICDALTGPALLSKCFITTGTTTPDTSREIFLSQALWQIPLSALSLEMMLEKSKDYYVIEFERGDSKCKRVI